MSTSPPPPEMKKTLGLTGLTMNAMALIAPGAFLWLTYVMQAAYGAPMAGSAMWFGIVLALLLCFATAISYAELSKLYPGAGSSYFFAEQAFLSKTHAYKFARLSKFIIGWASHLYYWVYPGVMVGVTAILVGYLASIFWPDTFNSAVNSPTLMIGFCVLFSFGVAYIAYNGVTGSTGVNIAINVIQISALIVFSVIAIGYRLSHNKDGDPGLIASTAKRSTRSIRTMFRTRTPTAVQTDQVVTGRSVQDTASDGKPKVDKDGKPVFVQDKWADDAKTPKVDDKGQPIWKQADKIIAKEDLENKDLPLPESYDSKFGTFSLPWAIRSRTMKRQGRQAGAGQGRQDPAVGLCAELRRLRRRRARRHGPHRRQARLRQDPPTFNYHTSAASVVCRRTTGTLPSSRPVSPS